MILLVIDTQRSITNESLYNFKLFENNVKKLIGAARRNQVEVIYVRHNDDELKKGTDGFEIYDKFAPVGKERVFDKTVNSAFNNTGLKEYLREKKENTVIIVGLQSDYCIDATIKCGFEHGFKMIVPANSNSTFDNTFMSAQDTYRYYNDFILNGRYAECVSVEKAIELMNASN